MRKVKADPVTFAELQTAAREAQECWRDCARELDRKYQDRAYAPSAKRRKLDQLDRAEKRARERFWRYLEAISPRQWDRGIPASWLTDGLTFADAVTREALSVIPPAAYGWDQRDRQFREIIGPIRVAAETS